ncbi:MAG: VTT domain-containing protein [Anaerolineaceae bacterium]
MLPSSELFQQFLVNLNVNQSNAHLLLYGALALAVMIEGPFAILIGATAASSGFLNPLPVFLAASLGNLMGDVAWYLLGYSGRLEWALKIKFLHLDMNKISLLKQSISRQVVKILVVAKLTNGLIVPALISTGLARVPLRRWFLSIFLTNLLTTGLFVCLGYFTAVNLLKFEHWIRYVALGFSFIFFIFISLKVRKWFSQFYSVEEILAEEESSTGVNL